LAGGVSVGVGRFAVDGVLLAGDKDEAQALTRRQIVTTVTAEMARIRSSMTYPFARQRSRLASLDRRFPLVGRLYRRSL
jgi:hypothetical protein